MVGGVGVEDIDLPRILVGLLVFLAPGFAWTWALLGHLGAARSVPLVVGLAFTLEPFAILVLNLVFRVPVDLGTGVYLSIALALAGVAAGVGRRLESLLPA